MAEFSMLIFWVVLLIVLIVVEAVTAQMVTIWFAAGAVAAMVAELLNAQVWLQWVIFIAVSVIALVATRPLVRKLTKTRVQPTNTDTDGYILITNAEELAWVVYSGNMTGKNYRFTNNIFLNDVNLIDWDTTLRLKHRKCVHVFWKVKKFVRNSTKKVSWSA